MISKLRLSSLLFIFSSYTLLAQLNSGPTTAAPTPPERNAEDVISIYSDAYENNTIDNFDFGLCPNSGANEEMIAGNAVQHYTGPGCQGILFENKKNILFCGSYFGYGFHEDGIKSTIEMLKTLND